jgi:hypothetical protein
VIVRARRAVDAGVMAQLCAALATTAFLCVMDGFGSSWVTLALICVMATWTGGLLYTLLDARRR